MKTPKSIRIITLALGLGAGATMIGTTVGCPQAQTAQNILQPAEACIINALFVNGGLQDPMLVVRQCAGVTIADVIQVIQSLLAQPTVTSSADAALGASMGVTRADLENALKKAEALEEAGAH